MNCAFKHYPLMTVLATATLSAAVRYVDVNNASPTPPYDSWPAAATNIQDAIDAADDGDLILVTNGLYQTGGRVANGALTNRIAVLKPLTVQSVNGPAVTLICGYQVPGATNGDAAVRCAYLTNGSMLAGFTLTNGATAPNFLGGSDDRSGGGVFCEGPSATVSNCVLTGNAASGNGGACAGPYPEFQPLGGTFVNCELVANSAIQGGAAFSSSLRNCIIRNNLADTTAGAAYCSLVNCRVLTNSSVSNGGGIRFSVAVNCAIVGNIAGYGGGGAWVSIMTNCTIVGNQSTGDVGGGFSDSTAVNCIVYDNVALAFPNYYNFPSAPLLIAQSCTVPQAGRGSITNAPRFVDPAGGNFRLQADSPCINSGRNDFAAGPMDLDGNPRIVGGTVDMGAYEFQSPSSILSYAWAQQYGLPTDGSADYADGDGDGHNNWQEWRCQTDPTNALSVLKLLTPQPTTNGVLVTWQSVSGQSYFLKRAVTVNGSFSILQSNILGRAGTTSATDTNTGGENSFFYRVGVPD